ncbi:TetR/AcrR family transcriptional regulator [Acinetobacter sp.]|uniref:TetR/AcrR family transcriptional regulator n=1 Tax=Acinetobacter sp. TaxID=472 RepID=UPI00258FF938|nr:TetR/AcrR family transcriptional regulator [Acinetobacter sp.]
MSEVMVTSTSTKQLSKEKKTLTGRPSRKASEALHEHLLAVATQHFLEYGFQGSSIERIAKEAQVSKLTIYRQYQNKTNLFIAVIQAGVDQYSSTVTDWIHTQAINETMLFDLGVYLAQQWLSVTNIRLSRIIIAEVQRIEELSEMIHKLMQQSRRPIEEFLEKLNQLPEYHIPNIHIAAIQFIQLCVSGHYFLLRDESHLPNATQLEENIRAAVHLFLNGYRARIEPGQINPV